MGKSPGIGDFLFPSLTLNDFRPKIDITISDALKRDHQCASIQLDFQLPQQFNLEYRTDEQFVKTELKLPQNHIPKHAPPSNDVNEIATKYMQADSQKNTSGLESKKELKSSYTSEESVEQDVRNHNSNDFGRDLTPNSSDVTVAQADPVIADMAQGDHVTNGEAQEDRVTNGGTQGGHVTNGEAQGDHITDGETQRDHVTEAMAQKDHVINGGTQGDHVTGGMIHRRELTPGFARPVMIHRGLLGSFERFIAILCEHFAGKWPFWLNPRQVLIVPVTAVVNDYAVEVQSIFRKHHIRTDVDVSRSTLTKKIRTGQLHDYSFIFVLGREERDFGSVNIRNRDDPNTHRRGSLVNMNRALEVLCQLRDERQLSSLVKFT